MNAQISYSLSKLERLKDIEKSLQSHWEQLRVFEVDASPTTKEKYFITFPYPYMNGVLHLGHAFSLSKAEFAAGFERMQGKLVLWPFGFHGTGMPIAACAKKLSEEIEMYGNPPQFPPERKTSPTLFGKDQTLKFQGKKGKKASNTKKQWTILEEMGCKNISEFRDPKHWLKVFPDQALKDLRLFGARIDYRRSFITTELNPYYDSFIRWQFNILKKQNRIHYGQRYTIYSPKDGQPCQDHDRATGEGVLPQEYTLIKLEIVDFEFLRTLELKYASLLGKKVFLAAATLRPETMFGQTNCWVSTSISYKGYVVNGEVLIMTQRSAMNLAHQNREVSSSICSLEGKEMIGLKVSAPMSYYKNVHVLPMETINEAKGTGIVTCVPSDSPDDYVTLMALMNKPAYREKLGIKNEWVLPFEPICIIEIPGSYLGTYTAAAVCKAYGVSSINDKEKLSLAKQEAYKEGYYSGTMIEGLFKGKTVAEARNLSRDFLIRNKEALVYSEPDGLVISRSGDECVVALTNQWYLSYGEAEWRSKVTNHIKNRMIFHNEQVKNGILESVDWLKEWACSRTFGLGTKLPFESSQEHVIDSLSDSTIYMAYYTVCHILHGMDNLDGSYPAKGYDIKPDLMTDEVWNYIFFGTPIDKQTTSISPATLDKMRREFLFWYPVDLRVSGKDLIQNHLIMSLYNHAAVWDEEVNCWPVSFFCNGHILIDKEKMSKSKGNFKTLQDAVHEYSADATRIALADAGDTLDDPNFVTANIPPIISKLTGLIDFCEEFAISKTYKRSDKFLLCDRIFANDIAMTIHTAKKCYEMMQYRAALHCIFYDFINLREQWRQLCGSRGMHQDLLQNYIEVQAKLLSPIAPHVAEYIYQRFALSPIDSLQSTERTWPLAEPINKEFLLTRVLLHDTLNDMRGQLQKSQKKTPSLNAAKLYCCSSYTTWQCSALEILDKFQQEEKRLLCKGDVFPKHLINMLKENRETKNKIQESLSFLAYAIDNELNHDIQALTPVINDHETLVEFAAEIKELTFLKEIEIIDRDKILPGDSAFSLATKARISKPTLSLHTI